MRVGTKLDVGAIVSPEDLSDCVRRPALQVADASAAASFRPIRSTLPGGWSGLWSKAVSAVVIGTLGAFMTFGAPLTAHAQAIDLDPPAIEVTVPAPTAAELTPAPIAVDKPSLDAESAAIAKASFDAGMKEGQEQRRLAAKIGMAPGDLLVKSKIPIVRNIGTTLGSIGRTISAPFTLVAGAVTADGDRAKDGAEDLARGLLGIVGLEHVVMGDYAKPGEGSVTGALSLPKHYATSITEAKAEWNSYSDKERSRDYSHGMKKWHTLSNEKLTANAGITELPWLWLGGLAHEIDPGGASAEIGAQGVGGWLWDSPLDVVANTMGMLGGLLLPDSAHQEYARIVGNIIPGPFDPFEQSPGTTQLDGSKLSAEPAPATPE